MSKLYYGYTYGINNVKWTYELHDDAAPVTAGTQINIIDANTEWQGRGKRLYEDQIHDSRTTLNIAVDSSSLENALKAMAVGTEQKHALAIYRETTLHWFGIILVDEFQFPRSYTSNYDFQLVAVDKLSLIGDIPFDFGTFPLSGERQTGIEIIREIIQRNYSPWTNTFWGASDTFIGDAITNTCTNMDSGLLFNTSYKKESFYKNFDISEEPDLYEWKSCKEAIEQILQAWGAQMIHDKGSFLIYQVESHEGLSIDYKKYSRTGADLAANLTLQNGLAIGENTRPCFEAKPLLGWQQAIRDYTVEYEKENWVSVTRTVADDSALVLTYSATVEALHTFKLKGRINDCMKQIHHPVYLSITPAMASVHCLVLGHTGSLWYTYDPAGGWTVYGASKPTGATAKLYTKIIAEIVQGTPPVNGKMDFEVEIIQPGGVEFTSVEVSIQVYTRYNKFILISGILTWQNVLNTYAKFTGYMGLAESYTNSNWYNTSPDEDIAQEYRQEALYTASVTANPNNSEKVVKKISYYSGSQPDIGGVLTRKTAVWYGGQNFTLGFSSTTNDIPNILAGQWAGLYTDAVQWIQGKVLTNGSIYACQSINIDSYNWVFNGGTFNYRHETFDGEWISVIPNHLVVTTGDQGQPVNYDIDRIYKTQIENLRQDILRTQQALARIDNKFAEQVMTQTAFEEPTQATNYQMAFQTAPEGQEGVWKVQQGYRIIKLEDETITSDSTASNDTELQFEMDANTIYDIKLKVYFNSGTTPGFKYELSGPASPTFVRIKRVSFPPGSSTPTYAIDTAYTASTAIVPVSEFGGHIDMEILVQNTIAGTFAFKWAQAFLTAPNTTVLAGSSLDYKAEPMPLTSGYLLTAGGDRMVINIGELLKKAQ